ncbi:MAG TPA: hypothetical protein VFM29_05375 [Vicinamibacteria bacterium]|nr:hypothetical protein [Vicinamibacteria bacterium]
MRIALAALAVALVALATPAAAADHVVTPEAVQAQLLQARAERDGHLASVERALGTPLAASAAAQVGADLEALRSRLPALSDAELADLAARAQALQADPVAGLDSDIRLLLMLFLILAIVILVLQAVD